MSETERVVVHDGRSTSFAVYEVMTKLMSLRMAEGSPANQHVTALKNLMNELDELGGNINDNVKVAIFLKSLPESYDEFVRLFKSMKEFKFYALLDLFEMYEYWLKCEEKKNDGVNNGSRSVPATCGEKKNDGLNNGSPSVPAKCEEKKNDGVNDGSHSLPATCGEKKNDGVSNGNKVGGPTGGIKKPKGKCFKCKESGHYKAVCPMKKP